MPVRSPPLKITDTLNLNQRVGDLLIIGTSQIFNWDLSPAGRRSLSILASLPRGIVAIHHQNIFPRNITEYTKR